MFKGEAQCYWTESNTAFRNGEVQTITNHFRGNEKYFEKTVNVFGGTGNSEVLPAGEHSFQFTMLLPKNLPSSFERKNGFVRYTAKGVLERPWKFDHEIETPFTVISDKDPRLDPQNLKPVNLENSKMYCCCCCMTGPVTLAVNIPAVGYVCGQNISMTIEVDNASKVLKVCEVNCKFQTIVTYYSTSPEASLQECTTSCHSFDGQVVENSSRTWSWQFKIPALPPSSSRESNIINIQYQLQIEAVPELPHVPLIHTIPIIIGAVPVEQSIRPQPDAELHVMRPIPSAPPSDSTPTTIREPTDPDAPPPTYEETMRGEANDSESDNVRQVFGTLGFKPFYPSYTFDNNMSDKPEVVWRQPQH
ncbi:arrestin domain-containing protein 17-like isoform X2 [Periplaneta americana]